MFMNTFNVKFYEMKRPMTLTFKANFIIINTTKDVKKRRLSTFSGAFYVDKGIICMGGVPENFTKRTKKYENE